MTEQKFLTRRQAATYLTDTMGLPVAERTLSKLSTLGGGPKYRKFGNRVLYTPTDLTTWAQSKLSNVLNNSSQEVQYGTAI